MSTATFTVSLRWTSSLLVVVLIVVALIAVASAAASGKDAGEFPVELTTTADGVFTAEQAERGLESYLLHCADCHGRSLEGGAGPSLAGESFTRIWAGSSLQRLFAFIRQQMPLEDPGSLNDEEYVDIIAHMLEVGGSPAGEFELPLARDVLERIEITPESSD